MRVRVKWFVFLMPLLVAAAPGRASDPALDALNAADGRVARIAWRLQTGSVGLCKIVVRLPGFSVHSLGQYAPSDRARVAKAYALGPRPAVLAVVPGSSAETAGLRAGDALVTIGGAATTSVVPAKADYSATGAAEDAVEHGLRGGPVALAVARGGATRLLTVAGDRGCASQVQIVPGSALGGQADGRYVQLTGASVDFATDDNWLAALMAHELAHNFLQHRARLDAEGVSRGLFAGFGKSGTKLRATEYEADRLSVWIVARAGFSIDAVLPFWTAWARRRDPGPLSDGTHPGWKDRLARIAAAVAVVRAQAAAGQPLVPPAQ